MTWKTVKLGNILTESKIPSTENNPDRRISVRLNKQGVEKRALKEERTGATKYYIRKAGQFIYGQQNLHKGAFGIIPEGLDGFESSNDLPAFDISNVCMPEWLIYFFSQNGFYKTLGGLATGIGSKRIYPKKIFDIEIPLPPLGEQHKIIERINNLEIDLHKLNDINEKNEKLAKQLKSSILQDAIQGKLVPQDPSDEPASILIEKIQAEKTKCIAEGKIRKQKPLAPIKPEEIPYELPKGWEWVRLGEIVYILGDGLHGTPYYSDKGEYYFINGNNLSDGLIEIKANTKRVSEEEYIKYRKDLNERTMFVSINGTLGNIAFYNGEKIVLGKSACYFNLSTKIQKQYIKKLFESPYFISYAHRKSTGTIIKNLGLKAMNDLSIPLPPINEQTRIVEKINEIMGHYESLDEEVRQAKARSEKLMESILQGVFNG